MPGTSAKTRWGWRIALLLIPAAAWTGWAFIPDLGWASYRSSRGVVEGELPGTNWKWEASAAFGLVVWNDNTYMMRMLPASFGVEGSAGFETPTSVPVQPEWTHLGVAWAANENGVCVQTAWWPWLAIAHVAALPFLGALGRTSLFLRGRKGRRYARPRWLWRCACAGVPAACLGVMVLDPFCIVRGLGSDGGWAAALDGVRVDVVNLRQSSWSAYLWQPSWSRMLDRRTPDWRTQRRLLAEVSTGEMARRPGEWMYWGFAATGAHFVIATSFIFGVSLVFALPLANGWRKRRIRAYRATASCCAHCGYPFVGLPEPRCPECGTRPDARDLPRSPGRLWPRLTLLLIPVAAWVVAVAWSDNNGPIGRGAALCESWVLLGDVPDVDAYLGPPRWNAYAVFGDLRDDANEEDIDYDYYLWMARTRENDGMLALHGVCDTARHDWLWVTWDGGRFLALHTTFLLVLAHLAAAPLLLWLWRRRRLRVWRRLVEAQAIADD